MATPTGSHQETSPTRAAHKYTHGHSAGVLKSHTWRTAENSAAYLLPHVEPSARVLDVGAGPGTITADFARICSRGSVVGVDVAGGIVEKARAMAEKEGLGNLDFEVADVMQKLPFEDAAFDVVHAHQVLQHVSEPVAALREMRRVCAPGGIVAARDSDYGGWVWSPANSGIDAWMREYQRCTHENGGDPFCGRNLVRYAREAGLDRVTASPSVWCFASEEDRAWWGEMSAERVKDSDFGDQMRESLPESALDDMVDGWKRWSGDTDGWLSILHGEIIAFV